MKRKILIFALLLLLVTALVPTTISTLLTTSAASPDTGWTLVTDARATKAYPDLKEYVWQKNATMPPNGQYDIIGLHRLVKTGITPKGVIFICPGTYCNGAQQIISNPTTDNFTMTENYSQPMYWANRGYDVYAIDYRTHFVPVSVKPNETAFMANWGYDQWISDTKEAVEKTKEVSGASKIFIAGESFGGSVAGFYASKYWQQDLRGIILLDGGNPIKATTTNTYNLTAQLNQMQTSRNYSRETPDIGLGSYPSGTLFFFQYASQNPGAPAQYPPGTPLQPTINPLNNKTWANITEWFSVISSSSFTNVAGGIGNITAYIHWLATMDRYWPLRLSYELAAISDWTNCPYIAYDYDDHFSEINVPLISFQSELFGKLVWGNITNGLATADFTSILLPGYGHVDVYSSIYSARDVSQPTLEWMDARVLTLFGNTAIGTVYDQNDANAQSVSYFKCTKSGVVTDIRAYISGTSAGNCKAAIYAVNGGSADAILAQSKAVSIGTAFSWVDFPLPTPYTVTAGITYGLAIMGDVSVNVMEVAGTGQRDHNAVSSYAKGFANPFGPIWGTDDRGAMSIYAATSKQLIGTEYVYSDGGYVVLNLPQGALYNKTNLRIGFMNVAEQSTKGAENTLIVRIWVPSTSTYGGIAMIDNNPVAIASLKKMYAGVSSMIFVLVNKDDLKIWKEGDYTVVNLSRPVDIQFGSPAAQIYRDLNFTLPPLTLRFMQSGEIFDKSTSNATYPSGWTSTTTTWTAAGWAMVQIPSWGCSMPTAAIIQPKIDLVAAPPATP